MAEKTADMIEIPAEVATLVEGLPHISASLPYRFPNSPGAQIEGLALKCAGCGAELSDIRGRFTEHSHNVSLNMYGICYGCKTITPSENRYSADGSSLHKSGAGWVKGTWGSKKQKGWVGKIKTLLRLT